MCAYISFAGLDSSGLLPGKGEDSCVLLQAVHGNCRLHVGHHHQDHTQAVDLVAVLIQTNTTSHSGQPPADDCGVQAENPVQNKLCGVQVHHQQGPLQQGRSRAVRCV